jgi:diguanylate cyclase (GGDEF)-like protein/PAS domain S-box-containing protein
MSEALSVLPVGEQRRLLTSVGREAAPAGRAGSAEALSDAFDAVPHGMAVVSSAGIVLRANPAMVELCGLGELSGLPYAHLTEPGDEDEIGEVLARLAGGTVAVLRRMRLRATDGTALAVLSTWTEAGNDLLLQVDLEAERTLADEALLRAQSASDAVVTVDPHGRICTWSTGAERLFGASRDDVLGTDVTRFVPDHDRAAHVQGLGRLRDGGEGRMLGRSRRLAAMRTNGTPIPVEMSLARWERDGHTYVTGILRDVSEQVSAERRGALLRATAMAANTAATEEEALRTVLPEAAVATGAVMACCWTADQLGLRPADLDADQGDARDDVDDSVVTWSEPTVGAEALPEARRRLRNLASEAVRQRWDSVVMIGSRLVVPVVVGGRVASVLAFWYRPTEVPSAAVLEVLEQVAGQVGRAGERDEARRVLAYRALHDPLTGLANRDLLGDLLEQTLTDGERNGTTTSVLFIDLDRFKLVNDSLGHAAGDDLLRQVAMRLQGQLRPGRDTVARQGGDEFVVLSVGVEESAAAVIAERLVAAFEFPFGLQGQEVVVGCSIGVATAAPGEHAPDEGAGILLAQADAAMYRAKERGRGLVHVFDADLRADGDRRLALRTALRSGLEREEFSVVYEPLICSVTGSVTGVEALLRWERPGHAPVGPGEFIPLAEDTGVVVELGAWVLLTACVQLAEWTRDPDTAHLRLSVNVSVRQVQSPGLPDAVRAALRTSGIDPSKLTLEITESVLDDDVELVKQRLRALKALGVKLAIDDFGTGYCSIAYLQDYPFDILKIDKSFVDRLPGGPQDAALVRAVVALAAALDLSVVAEGVEHREQALLLGEIGCAELQGWHFSKALSGPRVIDVVRAAGPI